MFIAQVLVGPSEQLKQITQTELNIVKNPNWPEADQLAIYKLGLELGTAGLRVRHADHSATLPPASMSEWI